MSGLIRYVCWMSDGEVVHDETVVCDVGELSALEKDVWVLGTKATLRIEFDPPLVVPREPSRVVVGE